MCDPATAVALISAGAGAGLTTYSNADAQRRQDREAAAGIMRNSEIQQRAGARVNEQIQNTTAANPEAERQAANDDFVAALQKAKLSDGGPALAPVGGASERFAEDVGTARKTTGVENRTLASNLARVDAPQYQRLREGQGVAATASDLDLLRSEASGNDFLTQLRVANQRANPWVTGLGQGLSTFGTAYAGRMRPLPVGGTGTGAVAGANGQLGQFVRVPR